MAINTSPVPWDHLALWKETSLKSSDSFLILLLFRSFFSRATTHTMPFCNLFSFCRGEPTLLFLIWLLWPGHITLGWPWAFLPQSWHGLVMPAGEGQHTCGCARLGLGGGWARVLITWGWHKACQHDFMHLLLPGSVSSVEKLRVFMQLPQPQWEWPLLPMDHPFGPPGGHLCSSSSHLQISGL